MEDLLRTQVPSSFITQPWRRLPLPPPPPPPPPEDDELLLEMFNFRARFCYPPYSFRIVTLTSCYCRRKRTKPSQRLR